MRLAWVTEEIAEGLSKSSGLLVKIGSLVFVKRREYDGTSQGY